MKKLTASLIIPLLFPLLASAWVLPDGSLDGKDFDSASLKGKAFVLFYVSPKQKELNMEASEELKAQKFDGDVFGSVAIIDLKSSWIPNGLIMRAIKAKQEKYPRTIYLKDKKRYMHDILKFEPTGNEIFAFDDDGKMVFKHQGKASPEKVKELIKIMKASVKEAKLD
jgi:predicted transcriptional regulator